MAALVEKKIKILAFDDFGNFSKLSSRLASIPIKKALIL